MLPYSPLHHLLMREIAFPVIVRAQSLRRTDLHDEHEPCTV